MLLSEIIQRIQSKYSAGVQSDDTRLSSRHIYNQVLTTRNLIMAQSATKGQTASDWNYQTIPCVELILTPVSECTDGIVVPKLLRSKEKFPRILNSTVGGPLLRSVTAVDGGKTVNKTDIGNYKYRIGNKYTSGEAAFFIDRGYLWLTTPTPTMVTVIAVFEDPLAAATYPSGCTPQAQCQSYLDFDFPMDMDMANAIVEIASKEFIEAARKQDRQNNSTDEIIP